MFASGVSTQGVALGEACVAQRALVGLLSCVYPLMALQLARLPETLGADGAHKVPLARVNVLVSLQMAGAFEGLATLQADMGFVLRMGDGVTLQVRQVVEDPGAERAVEDPSWPRGGRGGWGQGFQRVQGVQVPGSAGREDGGKRRGGRSGGGGEVEMVVPWEGGVL